jgi:glycogen(starch) synthase
MMDVIRLAGWLKQSDLSLAYHESDLVVVPSVDEPFGLVALESASCGTPALVADAGGLSELAACPLIWRFEPSNLGDCVRQVLAALSSDRDDLRKAGAAWVREHHSLEVYSLQLEHLYVQALGAGARSRPAENF